MARPAAGEELGDALDDGRVPLERDSHHLGDGLAGDVVLGGTEPPAHDHAVTAVQRDAQRTDDTLVVVPDGLVELRGDAVGRQVLAQPGRVGVGDLPQQQLGADRDDLYAHCTKNTGPTAKKLGSRPV